MYQAELGRFITRDPLPQEGEPDVLFDNNEFGEWLNLMKNLYGYCSADPTARTDSFGLHDLGMIYDADGNASATVTFPVMIPLMDPAKKDAHDRFRKWYRDETERGIGWLIALPPCPCRICDAGGKIVNPDPAKWTDPSSSSNIIHSFYYTAPLYHPGGAYEIRSTAAATVKGAGQQCVYDKAGKLITSSPAAGTVDLQSPVVNAKLHKKEDVIPYDDANTLGAEFLYLYYVFRPVNGGQGCRP